MIFFKQLILSDCNLSVLRATVESTPVFYYRLHHAGRHFTYKPSHLFANRFSFRLICASCKSERECFFHICSQKFGKIVFFLFVLFFVVLSFNLKIPVLSFLKNWFCLDTPDLTFPFSSTYSGV